MSYNGETIKDEALERFTCGLMEDVVRHYHDRIEDDNVDKLIERGIAKKLVDWIPEKYTEVDIKATVGQKYTSVMAEFMTDMQTMMVVVHEEVNSVEKNKIADPYAPYDPTSLVEDFIFPNPAYGAQRGSKVETLPAGHSLGDLDDLEYFRRKIQNATGVQAAASDAKKVAALNALIAPPEKYSVGFTWCKRDLSAPSESAPLTQKTPAGIDFSAISGIEVGKAKDWNRNTDNKRSTYYAIDTNVAMQESILNAEKETMIESASKRLQELAEQVMFDGLVGTAGTEPTTTALTMNELQELQDKYKDWTCGTSGWSDEFTLTNWDIGMPSMDKDDCTWSVASSMVGYNPYPLTPYNNNNQSVVSAMEEIEFSAADLEELSDLINEQISEKMKFA